MRQILERGVLKTSFCFSEFLQTIKGKRVQVVFFSFFQIKLGVIIF